MTAPIDLESIMESGATTPQAETGFVGPDNIQATHEAPEFEGPTTAKPKRDKKALGPEPPPELAEFFTEGGIGEIVVQGLDSFFVACGTDRMPEKQANLIRRVTAYYASVRLPKGAISYQPELLLAAAISFPVVQRWSVIGPATKPARKTFMQRVRGFFGMKSPPLGSAETNGNGHGIP